MSKKDGGPAFPRPNNVRPYEEDGMTLRDYFAAEAMQGLVGNGGVPKASAEYAYKFADAMLKAREGES